MAQLSKKGNAHGDAKLAAAREARKAKRKAS